MGTDDTLVGQVLGTYEIIRELGRGGMGMVYKAHETSLNRMVALKILPNYLASDDAFLSRFVREARAAASLVHPNVVTIYAVGEDQNTHFIAMEYVKGQTLTQLVRQSGSIHPTRALEIILEAASALAEAHKRRIIHRDIKPQNIMLDESGRVRVMDFGLAKATTSDSNLTADGALLGTPMYMSPEQCEGQPADQRSDIYSLGVVLYEMLTGHAPFEAPTPLAVMRQIVDRPFPDIRNVSPTVPDNVARILNTMVAKDVAKRYPNVEALRADIRNVLGVESSGSTPSGGTTQLASEETEIISSDSDLSYSGVTQGRNNNGLLIAGGLFAGLVIVALAIFAAGGGLQGFGGDDDSGAGSGQTAVAIPTPPTEVSKRTETAPENEQETNASPASQALLAEAAEAEARLAEIRRKLREAEEAQAAAERSAEPDQATEAEAARQAAAEEEAAMQEQLAELERRKQEAVEAERRAQEALEAEEEARLAAAAEAERARQLEAERAEIERKRLAAEEKARKEEEQRKREEAARAAAAEQQAAEESSAQEEAELERQRREKEQLEAELARIKAEAEAAERAKREAEEEAARLARLKAEEEAAAKAAATFPEIAGQWQATGDRPTAKGYGRSIKDGAARVETNGAAATVHFDDKTFSGQYNGGVLTAKYETQITATGRSGKGKTLVDQVWELKLRAAGAGRLEGQYLVTHSGFQASENHKNGTRSEQVVFVQ